MKQEIFLAVSKSGKSPWNKGKCPGQKKPFTPEQVTTIKRLLESEGNLRDLALFATAVDTMLRSGDILALKVSDVQTSEGIIREEVQIRQEKTGKGNVVSLTDSTRKTLQRWIQAEKKLPWDYLFTGFRKAKGKPISGRQYRNLVKKWAEYARLDPEAFSSHSLRRTKAAAIFQHTQNPEIVRQLLGHASIASTSHYLDISRKDALKVARKFEF